MSDTFEYKFDQLINAVTTEMDTKTFISTIIVASIIALVIWIAYKLAHTEETYSGNFGVTLVVLTLISTILMDLVQSNLALSLGMLGSLSIVRFRTNIKDPRDLGFIVWAMAAGISSATSNNLIGIGGSILLASIMILTKKSEVRLREMLLVVRGSNADLDSVERIARKFSGCRIKAKNILSDSFELVYEVKVKEEESNQIISNIFEIGGIDSVNLLSQKIEV